MISPMANSAPIINNDKKVPENRRSVESSGNQDLLTVIYGKRVVDRQRSVEENQLNTENRTGTVIMAILVIFAIPGIYVMKNAIRQVENPWIKQLQDDLEIGKDNFMTKQAMLVLYVTKQSWTLGYGVLLFMGGDAIIAFKTLNVYTIGMYIQMLIAFLLMEPRPFWVSESIRAPFAADGDMQLNYAAPNNHIFNLIFFWFYYLHQTLYKYAEIPHQKLMSILCTIVLAITAIVIFDSWLVGVMYFYQIFISALVTVVYLTACNAFDTEIMSLSMQTGFQKKESRKYKFYLMFLIMAMFLISTIIVFCLPDIWVQ